MGFNRKMKTFDDFGTGFEETGNLRMTRRRKTSDYFEAEEPDESEPWDESFFEPESEESAS